MGALRLKGPWHTFVTCVVYYLGMSIAESVYVQIFEG